jgi:hypothetical protein
VRAGRAHREILGTASCNQHRLSRGMPEYHRAVRQVGSCNAGRAQVWAREWCALGAHDSSWAGAVMMILACAASPRWFGETAGRVDVFATSALCLPVGAASWSQCADRPRLVGRGLSWWISWLS